MDLRLLPAGLAAWTTAVVAIGASASVVRTAVAVAWAATLVVVVVAVMWQRGRDWAAFLALPFVVAALVLTAVSAGISARFPQQVIDAAERGRPVTAQLTVTGGMDEGRLAGSIDQLRIGAQRIITGSIPVLIFVEPEIAHDRIPIGARLELAGRFRPTEAGDDRAWLVFVTGEPTVISDPAPILAVADDLRRGLIDSALGFPLPAGGLIPGLAIGDTSGVDDSLNGAMLRASLGHLTAVSGANCAVVIGLVFGLARALRAPRSVRIAAAAAALVAFVVLVTPEPSVLRAGVMAGVALAGRALGRRATGIALLNVSVVVLIIADPWLARSYGFVLSVLATAGLLVLAGPLAERLGRVMPQPLALAIAVPVAAQVACQPVVLLLDPSLALAGIPANILAAPAAPIATVLGLLACLTLPVLAPLGWLLTALSWFPAAWIAAVAGFFSGLPCARGPWIPGMAGVALLAAFTGAAAVAVLPGVAWRVRRLGIAAVAVGVCAYPLAVVGDSIATATTRPSEWTVAQCDVGQGDAVVIRSAGRVALIDTGREPEALSDCLNELGVGRIDLLVLTHYDLDHVGGTAAVIGRVDRVLVGPTADSADQALSDELRAGGAAVEQPSRGARGVLGEYNWELLWPPPMQTPGNPASIVLRFDPGAGCPRCPSAVLLGDLGAEEQLRLLGGSHPGPVDIVKVSHHGSADQAAELYARLHARIGLIGVGNNDYGHPTERLLGILAASGTVSARSDHLGLALIAPGEADGELVLWSERHPP